MKHYTLAPGLHVHAVIRQHTTCGLSLAFARRPEETTAAVTCPDCLLALGRTDDRPEQEGLRRSA